MHAALACATTERALRLPRLLRRLPAPRRPGQGHHHHRPPLRRPGRVGLGAGWAEAEYAAYGIPVPAGRRAARPARRDRAAVRGLLRDGKARRRRATHVRADATPATSPGRCRPQLPIWIGGAGERRTARIVARARRRLERAVRRRPRRWPASGRCSPTTAPTVGPRPRRDPHRRQRRRLRRRGLAGGPVRAPGRGRAAGRRGGHQRRRTLADGLGRYVAAGADTVNVALRAPWNPGGARPGGRRGRPRCADPTSARPRSDRSIRRAQPCPTTASTSSSGARVVVAGEPPGPPQPARRRACPFCVGGLEAPEPYDVQGVPQPVAVVPRRPLRGRALHPRPRRARSPTSAPAGARRVVDLWAERTAALGARDDVAYVLVFENRGAEVGATIAHPHGQIYAYDEVPDVPLTELRRADAGRARCAPRPTTPCAVDRGRRLAGLGARRPAPTPTACCSRPTSTGPTCPSLDGPAARRPRRRAGRRARPGSTGCSTPRCPTCCGSTSGPPTAAPGPRPTSTLHVVSPMRSPGVQRYVAAAELGSGVFVNPVVPEDAAAALRGA